MKNMKKIIISLITVLLVMCMGCTVFATEPDDELNSYLNGLRQEGNAEVEGDEQAEQIQEGIDEKEDEKTTVEDNKTETLPETTPHAGLEDYTGLIFVAVFAVSAIYAYKKVNEYNV